MPGTQTAGYDLVVQFSEKAYTDILGVFFDSRGLISKIAEILGINTKLFSLDISIDRPKDIPLGNVENPIDIRIGLGETGNLATLRMIVGVLVDRIASDKDTVIIDFAHNVYFAAVTVKGKTLTIPDLRQKLQSIIPSLPVLPIPVDRTSTNATTIRRADFKIIDDPSTLDRDATAGMLTFGGGSPGNSANLKSFVSGGARGAIGISFQWLCRMTVPKLESKLGLPSGSFTIGVDRFFLNRIIRVDEEEEVDLTSLTIQLVDGFIQIQAHVEKSGFCYDARGDVSARLRLEIDKGHLKANAEIGDPEVDVDIPWYCYVGAAVIGSILFPILFGAIGGLVAILVPIIAWLATDVIEKTINQVADMIAEAINKATPDVDVPAIGINIVFQDVFIDDVVLRANLSVIDPSLIHSEGEVLLHDGQGLDLDTGRVYDAILGVEQVDIGFIGARVSPPYRFPALTTGDKAAIAAIAPYLEKFPRYRLYSCHYKSHTGISLMNEWQTGAAVRTNEGRYAVVTILFVYGGQPDDKTAKTTVRLRYKTVE